MDDANQIYEFSSSCGSSEGAGGDMESGEELSFGLSSHQNNKNLDVMNMQINRKDSLNPIPNVCPPDNLIRMVY